MDFGVHFSSAFLLASWVPDWNSELSIPYGYLNSNTPLFSSGSDKQAGIWAQLRPKRVDGTTALVIPGFEADSVELTGQHVRRQMSTSEDMGVLCNYFISDILYFHSLVIRKSNAPTVRHGRGDEIYPGSSQPGDVVCPPRQTTRLIV